ncbi:MAG: ribbon-helix-helix domain-containing protein [Nitrososphaerales archaeon]
MEIVNVKVKKDTKEKLGRLVKRKAYANMSDAVRTMLEEHLREHPELFTSDQELDKVIREAEKMTDDQFRKIAAKIFAGRKTASEIVRDSRGGL